MLKNDRECGYGRKYEKHAEEVLLRPISIRSETR